MFIAADPGAQELEKAGGHHSVCGKPQERLILALAALASAPWMLSRKATSGPQQPMKSVLCGCLSFCSLPMLGTAV